MSEQRAVADNAIVDSDRSKIISDRALASITIPDYLQSDFCTEYTEDTVGAIRINVSPHDDWCVGLSVDLESGETGFDIGALVSLDRQQTQRLIEGLQGTLDALDK